MRCNASGLPIPAVSPESAAHGGPTHLATMDRRTPPTQASARLRKSPPFRSPPIPLRRPRRHSSFFSRSCPRTLGGRRIGRWPDSFKESPKPGWPHRSFSLCWGLRPSTQPDPGENRQSCRQYQHVSSRRNTAQEIANFGGSAAGRPPRTLVTWAKVLTAFSRVPAGPAIRDD